MKTGLKAGWHPAGRNTTAEDGENSEKQ